MVSIKTVEEYVDSLKIILEDISDDESTENTGIFQLTQFWENMLEVSKRLSVSCSKLYMCFGKPPRPNDEEGKSVLDSVMVDVRTLQTTVKSLPKTYGIELHKELRSAGKLILLSVFDLMKLASLEDHLVVAEQYVHGAAKANSVCARVPTLPRTNTRAVGSTIKNQAAMVNDAYIEITEALKGDGSDVSAYNLSDQMHVSCAEMALWSEADKENLGVPLAIIKGIKLLYKRVEEALLHEFSMEDKDAGAAENLTLWQNLDMLLENIKDLPEHVDDVVLSMYPPIDIINIGKICNETASKAYAVISVLQLSRLGTEQTAAHFEFVRSALRINLEKVDWLVAGIE